MTDFKFLATNIAQDEYVFESFTVTGKRPRTARCVELTRISSRKNHPMQPSRWRNYIVYLTATKGNLLIERQDMTEYGGESNRYFVYVLKNVDELKKWFDVYDPIGVAEQMLLEAMENLGIDLAEEIK